MENVVFQVTVAKINHENSNPNGESLTIHKEKDRVRGQEELPTPQHQRIDDEPVEMPQMDNASAKQLKDSVEKLEALLRFTQNDYVRADCKEGIAFLKDKIAAMIAMQALQGEVVPVRNAARSWLSGVPLGPGDRVLAISKTTQLANAVIGRNSSSTLQHQFSLAPKRSFSQANVASAASPVVQNHFDLQIEAAQVAAKEALQGEIVTARIAAAPVDSRTNQAGVAVAASKSTKQPVPANFNPATCPCPGKNKNPYAHFRSEKHELWMAMNAAAAVGIDAAAAVGIDQPIAAVKPHLQP